MRAPGAKAFPDAETVLDNALSPIEAIRAQRRRRTAATEAAALRRARAEQAGTAHSVPQLGRTA
ncbi:hypothetical protein [Streptomyces atratus]|uniref:hypothetical protein n=1 Tax=Streptomyces atratus TaxID=1893 RepID=UPI00225878B1|nr:hypothetical protein [Streptomyces atratus]MCX5345986.1 hypothetical protein [Streptomyces atratus]